jgi:hypothetical protein
MNIIKDVLVIKQIEKQIKRKLDDLELLAIYLNEPIYFELDNGEFVTHFVPLYKIPDEMLNSDVTYYFEKRGYPFDAE